MSRHVSESQECLLMVATSHGSSLGSSLSDEAKLKLLSDLLVREGKGEQSATDTLNTLTSSMT